MQTCIKIHPKDNVAVALRPLMPGQPLSVDDEEISPKKFPSKGFPPDGLLSLIEEIPQGHKFALRDIAKGQQIIKYGSPIGIATCDIKKGAWIHTHNMKTGLGELLTYTYKPQYIPLPKTKKTHYFQGFKRADGKVGVRNEIWIIPTVGCVNSVATAIEHKAQPYVHGTVDAIAAFTHPYGCSQMGEDQENTRRILADLISHPNAGGVLVLGLGCENSNIDVLKDYIGPYDPDRVKFLVAQDCEDEIEEGLKIVKELTRHASQFERTPIPCSELIVGMKCGGSDGLSGITANPTVGRFSDLLIAEGGTTVLTEVPEMFGAETYLMNRCENEALFEKTVSLINDFKTYFTSHNQTIYENPSPGNKKGGISSLEDKSLGCTQKSGSAPVKGVLAYGEPVTTRGLNLLSAPGNDLVASTALAASGAHIVLFTTGRGTPFSSPVPTVKISSNSPLYEHKKNWIDFNCGSLVSGTTTDYGTPTSGTTLEELGEELFRYVVDVASGRQVKAEASGFHDMAIFKKGVTL